MYGSRVRIVLLGLIVALVPGLSVWEVKAEPLPQGQAESGMPGDSKGCVGLDLILLVDHSGSMSGYKGQPASDPNNVRIESVKFIIDQLFINRLTFCPDTIHRIAVIGFGGSTELQLPPTAIDIGPNSSPQVWERRRDEMFQAIRPLNLLNTDFELAFDAARDLLTGPALGPLPDATPRKRAIVVLTDGNPCVGSACSVGSNEEFDAVGYMQDRLLPKLSDPNGPFAPWQSAGYDPAKHVYIWLVAINNAPLYLEAQKGTRSVGDLWREITEAHGGYVYSLGQHPRDIPGTYVKILNQLLGSNLESGGFERVECGQPVYVDPYVQRVFFHFLKDSSEIPVSLRFPDDQIVLSNGGLVSGPPGLIDDQARLINSYQRFGPIERYALDRPPAGMWDVQTSCEAVVVYKQTLMAQVDLLQPVGTLPQFDEPPYYDRANPSYLRGRLRGADGQPFSEDARFPLRWVATLTEPDGTQLEPFELKPQGNGVYSSQGVGKALPQGKAGLYRVHLRVTTRHADPDNRGELVLYDATRNAYAVRAVQWFDFNIVAPRQGERFNLVQYQGATKSAAPLEVVVQLTDRYGNPLAPDGVLFDFQSGAFTARLTTPVGRSEEVPLEYDAASPGEFRGWLRSGAEALADPPGKYHLVVLLSGQHNAQDFSPRRVQAESLLSGVAQFDFRVVSPTPGQSFNLVHYQGETPLPVPLPVTVQLTYGDGSPLVAEGTPLDSGLAALVANLTTPQGRTETVALVADQENKGQYRALLRTGPEAVTDPPGDYHIQIQLTGQTSNDEYVPLRSQAEVRTTGIEVTPVDYRLVVSDGKTASQPLYQGSLACINAQLVPIRFAIWVFDPRSPEQYLDPTQLAKSDAARLFSAELVDPASNTENVPLSVQLGEQGLHLVGIGGTASQLAGQYVVRVTPNPDAWRSDVEMINARPALAQLVREDSVLSRPGTCLAAGSGLAGLLLILIAFLVWNVMARPVGTLSFVHRRTGVVLHEEQLGRPLRGWWRTYRSRHPGLAAVDLDQLNVTRGKGSPRAINLELFDQDGNLVSRELNVRSGSQFDLDAQVVVRYD